MDSVSQPRFDASFPCKGLVCHISDMCIWWFWKKIWHGSISGNICLIEVSNPAKFDAFIKKRTILSLNSWTNLDLLGLDEWIWTFMMNKILRKQHLIVKQHFYKLFGKQYGLYRHCSLWIRLHMSIAQCCFCSLIWKQNKLAFDCTFQSCSFKKNMAMDLDHD